MFEFKHWNWIFIFIEFIWITTIFWSLNHMGKGHYCTGAESAVALRLAQLGFLAQLALRPMATKIGGAGELLNHKFGQRRWGIPTSRCQRWVGERCYSRAAVRWTDLRGRDTGSSPNEALHGGMLRRVAAGSARPRKPSRSLAVESGRCAEPGSCLGRCWHGQAGAIGGNRCGGPQTQRWTMDFEWERPCQLEPLVGEAALPSRVMCGGRDGSTGGDMVLGAVVRLCATAAMWAE
jgi:hypothetical protein